MTPRKFLSITALCIAVLIIFALLGYYMWPTIICSTAFIVSAILAEIRAAKQRKTIHKNIY